MSRLADLSDPSAYKLKRSGRPAGLCGIGHNTTQVGHVCQEPRSWTHATGRRYPRGISRFQPWFIVSAEHAGSKVVTFFRYVSRVFGSRRCGPS
jgi:hypothetical protein